MEDQSRRRQSPCCRLLVSEMLMAGALTQHNLHQAIYVGLHILRRLQPRLGQTRSPLALQACLIDRTNPPLILKKQMKSLWVSFYGVVFVGVWVSKIFCLNRQAFVNILGRLLHIW